MIQQYTVSLALQRFFYLPQCLALEMQCNAISALKEWCFYLAGHSVNGTVTRNKEDLDEV